MKNMRSNRRGGGLEDLHSSRLSYQRQEELLLGPYGYLLYRPQTCGEATRRQPLSHLRFLTHPISRSTPKNSTLPKPPPPAKYLRSLASEGERVAATSEASTFTVPSARAKVTDIDNGYCSSISRDEERVLINNCNLAATASLVAFAMRSGLVRTKGSTGVEDEEADLAGTALLPALPTHLSSASSLLAAAASTLSAQTTHPHLPSTAQTRLLLASNHSTTFSTTRPALLARKQS
ncbi:hypothetical protein BT69DRAFT_1343737 [Atractiella rhizophila]|nr:hypothetical protein BT69DRAFT_1343737 [Atractiella rhizophila]